MTLKHHTGRRDLLPAMLMPALVAGAMLTCSHEAEAKRASRQTFTVTQPDGSTLRLHKEGDEFGHLLLTDDGVAVTRSGDTFYFTELSADGVPQASSVPAAEASARTEAQTAFLKANPSSAIARAVNVRADLRRKPLRRSTRSASPKKGPGLCDTSFPTSGEQKGIAILVEFKDRKFRTLFPQQYFDNMLNGEDFTDYGGTGSARQYFIQNSQGQFRPTFDVYGPVTLSNNMSYYGGNNRYGEDSHPEDMVLEACRLVDDIVDFNEYDRDGNKIVDNVYIFYAGYGEADYYDPNTIWPHSFDITSSAVGTITVDGCMIDHYACSNELDGVSSNPDGIGTFTHEFSHVLGLPDLYCTVDLSARNEPFTPGAFSILDYGPYNNNGRTPPNYSAYERYALGWMTPEEITESTRCDLPDLAESNKAYIFHTERSNEYFLMENRRQEGWDAYIPGHGMLVWHVDFVADVFDNNIVNNNKNHQYVDLVEADNAQTEVSRNADTFPGAYYVTEFTPDTTPAFVSWSGKNTGYGLYYISEDPDTGHVSFAAVKKGDDPEKFDPTLDPGPGAVDDISSEAAFTLQGRTLTVSRGTVGIFDLSGMMVGTATPARAAVLPGAGVYIVRNGSEASKIMVK